MAEEEGAEHPNEAKIKSYERAMAAALTDAALCFEIFFAGFSATGLEVLLPGLDLGACLFAAGGCLVGMVLATLS